MKNAYSLDAICSLYVFCSDTVEKFAERYDLSPTLVESYVREGRWNELRAAHSEKAQKLLMQASVFQLEDGLDVALKFQSMRNVQENQQVEKFAEYFHKYGDFWARNPENEEVLKDAFGFPIPLRIPSGLKGPYELAALLRNQLAEMIASMKTLDGQKGPAGPVMDAMDYKHLLKPKKKDGDV